MNLDLTQPELLSYQEKYNRIVKVNMQLDFKQTKKLIIGQFSITNSQAISILNKVFDKQQGNVLNKEGFFMTLRYIQCLQNNIDIETCNINTIKLKFPLVVNSKNKLTKSFSVSQFMDPLDKSMKALNQLESIVEEHDSIEGAQLIQYEQQQNNNLCENQNVQKQRIKKFGDIQMNTIININPKEEEEEDDVEIIQPQTEHKQPLKIWISNYQKESLFASSYVYDVCSLQIKRFIVKRRDSDFKLLQQYLGETYQGDYIPQLPEDGGLMGNLYSFVYTDKLSQRVEQLEQFLKQLSKYQDDEILKSFLTEDQSFEIIINNSRNEVFLPNPEEYRVKDKILSLISFSGYQNSLFDYLKGNTQIEAKFQAEYEQAQQNYKNLEIKKQLLAQFEKDYIQFQEPLGEFLFPLNQAPLSVIGKQNIAHVQQMQQIQIKKCNQLTILEKNYSLLDHIQEIKFKLESVTTSFEYIDKQIYKWFAEKQRFNQDQYKIQQNQTEENRLQFVITKTNDSLVKQVQKTQIDFQKLLDDFIIDIQQ